jgi:hypothetical protein
MKHPAVENTPINKPPHEMTPEELKEYIQHIYSLGYAKGMTENLEQWLEANKTIFVDLCKTIVEVYKEIVTKADFSIKNIFYKCNHHLNELEILLVIDETKFEEIFPNLNTQNNFFKNVLGINLRCNISIYCMSDSNINEDAIKSDFPHKL